jgi:hypothetical protein
MIKMVTVKDQNESIFIKTFEAYGTILIAVFFEFKFCTSKDLIIAKASV